jgi:hypothetical protein
LLIGIPLLIMIFLLGWIWIFMPQTHRGSTWRKMDAIHQGQRALAHAIEAYYADHQAYPAMHPMAEFTSNTEQMISALKQCNGNGLCYVESGNPARGLAGVTTPVAYIEALPRDIFPILSPIPLAYFTDGRGWILFSAGPDTRYDVRPDKDFAGSDAIKLEYLMRSGLCYDPSNGTTSNGDMIMLKRVD